ncbi:P-loop containing nucleoside triphosphate hydrolase protein [Echria macrotheca]|uniref:P-loop containing nucleoside triphosphate hydrolase protein n=1 Tax=Echria macrotheca TaxID=438768 RepID=A0AAJ0B9X7_9PEZI|nr:P-loop containing nucleoside triphosphate hydrolase protein [Echria macrotheca]
MGNEQSLPQPGAKLRVIGAGYPRTGTESLSKALALLLHGPVYHGGTQITRGPPSRIKAWTRLLTHYPPQSAADRALIQSILENELSGFAATTDAPAAFLVPELLQIHPSAIVIVTTRDVAAWERSIGGVATLATLWFLRAVLLPLPTMRHFVGYIDRLRELNVTLYGEAEPLTRLTWDRHIARLREVVPAEKLFFYDVRDGWEPLCQILGTEVPDVPFPRGNDGEAIERLSKEMITRGLMRWLVIFATLAVAWVAWRFV